MRTKMLKVCHRDFLGAYRYTTRGGTVRRGVLRTVLSASQSKEETYSFPFGCLHPSPLFVYFASGDDLKNSSSPSTKSAVVPRWYRVLPQRPEGGNHSTFQGQPCIASMMATPTTRSILRILLITKNASGRYKDPSILWKEVELTEKALDAQFVRTIRFEIPNDWSYELAKDVVKSFCQKEYVDKGMCCQYAIHNSKNKEMEQRNLHVHILLNARD